MDEQTRYFEGLGRRQIQAAYAIMDTDQDMVAEADACPKCGERRQDWLVWVDDDTVECQTCGIVYEPGAVFFAADECGCVTDAQSCPVCRAAAADAAGPLEEIF